MKKKMWKIGVLSGNPWFFFWWFSDVLFTFFCFFLFFLQKSDFLGKKKLRHLTGGRFRSKTAKNAEKSIVFREKNWSAVCAFRGKFWSKKGQKGSKKGHFWVFLEKMFPFNHWIFKNTVFLKFFLVFSVFFEKSLRILSVVVGVFLFLKKTRNLQEYPGFSHFWCFLDEKLMEYPGIYVFRFYRL